MRIALLGGTGRIGRHLLTQALADGPGRYRVRADYPPPGGGKIARADVAAFMLTTLADNGWIRAAPALAY
jgi:uncharacterized protein YbjT (DUF2867 family)